jgi:hypothetical protein
VLFEENARVLYSVVLRVGDQEMTGIETLMDRITPHSRFKPDSLARTLAGMSRKGAPARTVPAGDV